MARSTATSIVAENGNGSRSEPKIRRKLRGVYVGLSKASSIRSVETIRDHFGEEGDLTLSEAFRRFSAAKRKQGWAESTINSYCYTWSALTDALREECKIDDLTASQIESFLHGSDAARS
jgi:hypothetical protein